MTRLLRRGAFWLLWLVVFTVPWQNSLLLPSLGTTTRAVGLLAAGWAGVALLRDGRRHRLLDVHLVVWLLGGWALLSVFWSTDPASSFSYASTALQIAVLVTLVWEFGDEEGDLARLLRAYVSGCVLGSLSLLRQAGQAPLSDRYTAAGFNENDLGLILALGLPVAWYLALQARSATEQFLMLAYLPLGLSGAALTGTRSALVVAAVGLVIVPLTWRLVPKPLRLASLLSAAVSGLALLLLVPVAALQRLGTLHDELAEGDLTGRTELWRAAASLVSDNPVVGSGGGTSLTGMSRLLPLPERPHNAFLSVAADLGGVGLLLFLLVLLLVGLRVVEARSTERAFAGCLLAALVVALLPVHWEHQKAFWILIALVLTAAPRESAGPVDRHLRQQRAEEVIAP